MKVCVKQGVQVQMFYTDKLPANHKWKYASHKGHEEFPWIGDSFWFASRAAKLDKKEPQDLALPANGFC